MALSPTNHTLTQGSSLCSPTLGYQKRNPYGVRRPHEKRSLWAVCPFERNEIKKAQHLRRCVPRNTLTQGSSLRSPTLGYQKRNPYGVRQFCKHPLRPLFLLKWLSKTEPLWGSSILQTSSACASPLLGEGLEVRL